MFRSDLCWGTCSHKQQLLHASVPGAGGWGKFKMKIHKFSCGLPTLPKAESPRGELELTKLRTSKKVLCFPSPLTMFGSLTQTEVYVPTPYVNDAD